MPPRFQFPRKSLTRDKKRAADLGRPEISASFLEALPSAGLSRLTPLIGRSGRADESAPNHDTGDRGDHWDRDPNEMVFC